MGEYIMTLIGAGIMCALSEIISPDKWHKYIQLFTGVLIAILIVSPVKNIDMNVLDDISYTAEAPDESILKKEVQHSLEERINTDITSRIKENFGCESVVKTDVISDSNGDITGIYSIEIETKASRNDVKRIICAVYGLDEARVKVNGR